MNILEILGAVTLVYLIVGSIVSVLVGPVTNEDDTLGRIVYSFIHVMCWPLVLAEAFVPAVRRTLHDPDRPDDEVV